MFNKDPKKINSSDSGIDFSKSEMISKYFKKHNSQLYSETTPGPVIGEELIFLGSLLNIYWFVLTGISKYL